MGTVQQIMPPSEAKAGPRVWDVCKLVPTANISPTVRQTSYILVFAKLILCPVLVALEAGCEQQPVPGTLLGLSGSLFSESSVNTTSNNTTASPKDDTPSHLSTGAIVGIAVGTGVLFLAGIVLFILYYCRQKRYNKEDRARRASYASYLHSSPYSPYKVQGADIAVDGPSYTMDYKSPGAETNDLELTHKDDHLFGEATGAYTYRPRQQPTHTRHYSQEEMHESPSAMPTHPAYIPRAVIRRNSPTIANSSQFSSTMPSREASVDSHAAFTLSAPPPVRKQSRSRMPEGQQGYHSAGESTSSTDYPQRREAQTHASSPGDTNPLDNDIHHTAVHQLQQHGIYASDQPSHHQPDPSPRHNQLTSLASSANRERSSSTSSNTPRSHPQSQSRPRPDLPHLILPGHPSPPSTTTSHRRPTPRSNPVPLPGLESIEISGPLAFPHQQPPGSGGLKTGSSTTSSHLGQTDKRTFRERSNSGGGGGAGVGVVGPGAARFAAGAVPVGIWQDHIVEQNFIRKGWVEEVPLQSAKDSLW